ncbi:hypothetical protein [Phormidium sp. FACHB-1136]|uniref:hypothetical protein n=1 Tax=Phormidium sp. FACHB-1136 TaxID=2692848 RepID=UPI00168901F0|nr:hypothetical protein [Phormidium sp. FACHB-1136]MBD2425256.1 hypothetical protein [Phormidium sp. FACHB-1136]
MGLEIYIPLTLSVITALAVATRNLLGSYSKQIALLTRLDENVKVALVGLESLRIIDTDTNSRLDALARRLDDLERYLQLASAGQYPHPFTPRAAHRD